jgi:hypothetical protein
MSQILLAALFFSLASYQTSACVQDSEQDKVSENTKTLAKRSVASTAVATEKSETAETTTSKIFGEKPTLVAKTHLSEAIKNYESYAGKDILIEGKVGPVCQSKGCWMTFEDKENSVRMTFKNYGFFVPKNSAGNMVTAQGRLEFKTESVKDQVHYLKDAGAKEEEIKKITAPKKVYNFVASGLTLNSKQ